MIGVLTLLHSAPIGLAMMHQAMALVVLTAATIHAARTLSPRRSRHRPVADHPACVDMLLTRRAPDRRRRRPEEAAMSVLSDLLGGALSGIAATGRNPGLA